MKNDLSCAVVRDLLPSYIDGLTAPETNGAVEAHLRTCPDCARLHRQMAAPEAPPEQAADREVDYLRQVRRRGRLRVMAAVLMTAALLLGGLAAKVFLIGSPAASGAMAWEVTETDTGLRVQVMSGASANAWWGWKQTREGNVVTITCREGLVSPVHSTAYGEIDVPLDSGVTEVRLVDRVIWQEGTVIDRRVLAAWNARTPYVGDMPALNNLANALNIRGLCGDYTNTLHTSGRPYGWTLEFADYGWNQKDAALRDREMERMSLLLLALVDNLEEVRWTWKDQSRAVTLAEADAALPALYSAADPDWAVPGSVKDCAESPSALQRLWTAAGAR
ncbi:DUF4825 domain-containing protein [Dysosmobacter sp.]|uniref:DUF4825 domain-containing protein n=1 Tax=Dysosmobacter sp. TaxID=2591382 RepID=UPI002A8C9B95|nr:DUF4825 domain-containing protein [Dysosmobacter sp.]MDY3282219.1 DUF4825 domain-containing protein [Dysosmobacter sp.]